MQCTSRNQAIKHRWDLLHLCFKESLPITDLNRADVARPWVPMLKSPHHTNLCPSPRPDKIMLKLSNGSVR